MVGMGSLGGYLGRVNVDVHAWMKKEKEAYARLPVWQRVKDAAGEDLEDGIDQVKELTKLRRAIVLADEKAFLETKAATAKAAAAAGSAPRAILPTVELELDGRPRISAEEVAALFKKATPEQQEELVRDLARTMRHQKISFPSDAANRAEFGAAVSAGKEVPGLPKEFPASRKETFELTTRYTKKLVGTFEGVHETILAWKEKHGL